VEPTFHRGIEEIYWGTAVATPPIDLESDIGLPQYHIIGESCIGGLLEMLLGHTAAGTPCWVSPHTPGLVRGGTLCEGAMHLVVGAPER
jgi:hypothetical protein